MSTSVVSQNSAIWSFEASDIALGAGPQLVVASSMFIFQIEIDNTANTSAASYVKVYDDNSAASVTVGTSVPMAIFPAPAGTKLSFTFPYGVGTYFANGIVWACVNAPGTAGTTAPTSSVICKMMYNAT